MKNIKTGNRSHRTTKANQLKQWHGKYDNFIEDIKHFHSRYSDWLPAGRPRRGRSSSPGRVKNFLFSKSSRPALGSTQPPIQWVPGALAPGGKVAGA
jgi:hypothetical protein